jgi:hypothetical protein
MSRFSAAQQSDTNAASADEVLFKPDRPRHIDRFIDYFGTTGSSEPETQESTAFLSALEDDN